MLRRDLRYLRQFVDRKEENKSVLIVQGARQVGKTYLIEAMLSELRERTILKFNLEKDVLVRAAIDDCRDFQEFNVYLQSRGLRDENNFILFIDEAQESEKLGSFVRFMKEEWKNVSVILSGSSITKLFKSDVRVPVGRVEYYRVTPLSFPEFIEGIGKLELLNSAKKAGWVIPTSLHNELISIYDRYLNIGGMPRIVSAYVEGAGEKELKELRAEIYLSQKDDFQRKEKKLKSHLFIDGTKAVADLVGFPFNLSRISNNHRDAKNTLEILNDWLISYRCEQRGSSPTTVSHPKVYLYDIGILKDIRESVLPNLSLADKQGAELRTSLGGLIENAIYLSFQTGKGFLNEVNGWRKTSGVNVEVDFVIKLAQNTIPIEVKASQNISKKYFNTILTYLNFTKQNLGVLVSAAPYQKVVFDEMVIHQVPVYACSWEVIEGFDK